MLIKDYLKQKEVEKESWWQRAVNFLFHRRARREMRRLRAHEMWREAYQRYELRYNRIYQINHDSEVQAKSYLK